VLGGLSGACPAISFPISGQVVVTNAATAFVGGSCSAISAGASVSVSGTVVGDVVIARTVTIQ
jgi:hypothetical protein